MKRIFPIAAIILTLRFPVTVFAAGVNGDAQISGNLDGSPIILRTADRIAGAVDSITWKGRGFVSGMDHGRSIQYAWFLNGSGCDNPTEAGSADDGTGPTSSSILESITANGNALTTVSHPAFWGKPGETDPAQCPGGATNKTIVSNDILQKTVTIGYQNLPNVIEFQADISLSEPTNGTLIFPPISYQPGDIFPEFWTYSPKDDKLTDITGSLTLMPGLNGAKNSAFDLPVILSTADGHYAIGLYAPDGVGLNAGQRQFYVSSWPAPAYIQPVNTVGALYTRGQTPAGTYHYQSFLIIGSLNEVAMAIKALYLLLPANIYPVVGTLDTAGCSQIAGWAGDKDNPDSAINVRFYIDNPPDQGGTFIGETTANTIREQAVCNRLGSTQFPCPHGFVFLTPAGVKDGQLHNLYAEGINLPGTPGQNVILAGSPKTLICVPGDLTGDGRVDIFDLRQLLSQFTDIFDINLIVKNFGL